MWNIKLLLMSALFSTAAMATDTWHCSIPGSGGMYEPRIGYSVQAGTPQEARRLARLECIQEKGAAWCNREIIQFECERSGGWQRR